MDYIEPPTDLSLINMLLGKEIDRNCKHIWKEYPNAICFINSYPLKYGYKCNKCYATIRTNEYLN